MKRLLFVLVSAVLLLALTIPVAAQIPHPTVICNGNRCGGNGPFNYYYEVSVWPEELFTSYGVGVHDPVLADYLNITVPVGWQVSIMGGEGWQMPDDPFTQHGQVTGNSGQCPFTLFWSSIAPGSALQSYNFGFNYDADPHDTGWVCSGIRENWGSPLGTGAGPVHTPVPEPGSLLALGSGLTALLGMALGKRH